MAYSIKQRDNGSHYVEFKGRDGERKRLSLGVGDKDEAARNIFIQYWMETARPAFGMTLGTALDKAMDTFWSLDMVSSITAYRSVRSDCRLIGEALGRNLMVQEITTERLSDYVKGQRKAGLAYSTIDKHLKRIRRLMTAAATEWQEHDGSPVITQRPVFPKLPRAEPRDRILTAGEEIILLDYCRNEGTISAELLGSLITFTLETALRKSELVKMPRTLTEDGYLHIDARISKSKSSRIIPLSLKAELAFLILRDRKFTNSSLDNAWRAAREACGIEDIHWHDLRHTAITRWRDKGIPLDTIARLAGSGLQVIYDVYDKPNAERLRKDMEGTMHGKQ